MSSVTFSPSVGGDGSTVTDDSNPTTGLDGGGHRTRFVPALAQVVAVAAHTVTKASQASSSATSASSSATSASSSATSASSSAASAAATAADIQANWQDKLDAAGQSATDAELSAASSLSSATVATAQAALAGTARAAAETARDSSYANAKGADTIANARALVADNDTFIVYAAGALTFDAYRRTSSSTQTYLGTYPSADLVRKMFTPFSAAVSATNAGGSVDLYNRLLAGVVDVRMYGLDTSLTYYVDRIHRNVSGVWTIFIKRTSDNSIVLTFSGALTEPTDPTSVHVVALYPSAIGGPFGFIALRWSEFTAGASVYGLTMTLHPDCHNRTLSTEVNSMPASSARVGNVPLTLNPAAFVSVNETTRTVTWPELRICDGYANSSGYFKIAAGFVTFDANLQIAWIDLSELASPTYAGGAAIPASVVKKGTYGWAGESPAKFAGLAHQWPIAWSSGAGRVDLNPALRQAPPAATTVYRDDMVVKVDQANNIVSVYVLANGSDTASLTYIHYRLYHHIASDADVWTIDGIWEVARTGYEAFSGGKEIQVSQVEILCALQEVGAADFMGGRAHGCEVITQAPTLLIDGREVSLTSGAATWHHAREVTFVQSSKLYRDGSLATPLTVALARRKLWLCWKQGEMLADQRIEHLASYSLTAGYLAMLAPHRYETYVGGTSENTGSAQISGYYADNVRMIPMDATARQASQVADDYVTGQAVPVTRVKLWGSYGIESEMEVLETSVPILKNLMYVNRTNYAYNKAYIGFISGYSGVQNVTTADKWQIKTRWRIGSKN